MRHVKKKVSKQEKQHQTFVTFLKNITMDKSPNQSRPSVGNYEYEKIDLPPYLLGKGNYGKVYKGYSTINPQETVAIKICPVEKSNYKLLKRVRK